MRYRLIAQAGTVTARPEAEGSTAGFSTWLQGATTAASLFGGMSLWQSASSWEHAAGAALFGGGLALGVRMVRQGTTEYNNDVLARNWIVATMNAQAQRHDANDEEDDAPAPAAPPESAAELKARRELMRLLSAAAAVAGWDSTVIPSAPKLGWRPQRRLDALRPIEALLIRGRDGTFLRPEAGTVRDLHDKLRDRKIRLALPPAGSAA